MISLNNRISAPGDELTGLKRIIDSSFCTSLVIIPLSVFFSVITGSGTLLIYFIWTAVAITVKLFALISVRIMIKENRFLFPYGSGKLENFSSFFFGFTIVPLGIFFLIDSAVKLFSPLQGVTYLFCQIPVVISFLLTWILLLWTKKLIKDNPDPSPLLKAYYINFRISLVSDSFLFLGFLIGYVLSSAGLGILSLRVDPVLSVILSIYMLWVGLPLIIENFRSLIDLPLHENDMLKIMKVVAGFYQSYSGLGMIYSRRSGKKKIIEVELFFDRSVTLTEISRIERSMAREINQIIPGAHFRLLPNITEPTE